VNFNRPGAVGMAHPDGSNVNGSQFFLTLASNRSLDGHFTNFGHVTEGLDVLPRIARGEPPTSPTRMSRVYIVEKAK
jgi:peptidylprolyl isomerase